MYNFSNMGSFMWFGWLLWILFIVVIILGISALVKWLAGGNNGRNEKTAREILEERLAKGEINEKQFSEKIKLLKK